MVEEKSTDTVNKKSKPKEIIEIPKKFEKIVKDIEILSVLDLSELVTVLEKHFNVSAAPVAVAVSPASAGSTEAAAPAAEKSAFTVTLTDAGSQKVAVIKAVKEVTGLGLGESKALVDEVPKVIKENVPKDEADAAKVKLEEAGAKVEVS